MLKRAAARGEHVDHTAEGESRCQTGEEGGPTRPDELFDSAVVRWTITANALRTPCLTTTGIQARIVESSSSTD